MVIDRDQVMILWSQIRAKHKTMKDRAYTRKTKGTKYPISEGYSNHMKRPVRDLLHWMSSVEDLLELILEELD